MPGPSSIVTAGAALVEDLAVANRILFQHEIVDGFGHVSARHDKDPNKYLMAHYLAPGIVTPMDIRELSLDSIPIPDRGEKHYSERFIHGEIYKARPDVMAVVHSHAPPLIPFGATGAPLKPIYHVSAFLGQGVPVFEIRNAIDNGEMLIRTAQLGKALAGTLGDKPAVLMRGHGATIVGSSLKRTVYRAIYAAMNARLQMEALKLGEVRYLTAGEAAKHQAFLEKQDMPIERPWALWKSEAIGKGW